MAPEKPDSLDKFNPTDGKDRTDPKQRLRPGGGYRRLHSFQTATLIYDATVSFCERLIDPHSRTRGQMVQVARSGRQNIAEGNRAGATSSASEIHLTNVARASLDDEDGLAIGFTEKWPEGARRRNTGTPQKQRGKAMKPVTIRQRLEEPGCAESQSGPGGQDFQVQIPPSVRAGESPPLQTGKLYGLAR